MSLLIKVLGHIITACEAIRQRVDPRKTETTVCGDEVFTVWFRESQRADAARMQRHFADMYNAAKSRGLIRQ
jgi:hypothetical protein